MSSDISARPGKPAVPRVLIVDDDETVRDLLSAFVESLGIHLVANVSDGTEAVDFITKRGDEVDLVFLDLVMKKLHGNVALPILKSRKPSLRVIIISAFFMNYNTHFLANLGADGFLEKPFTLEQLRAVVDRLFPGACRTAPTSF